MQKLVITTITGGLLAASSAVAGDFSTPIASAPAPAPAAAGGALTVGYNSVDMFRGMNRGTDQVTAQVDYAVANPIAGFDLVNFSAWYGSNERTAALGNELRLSAGTSYDLGFAKANVGYILYHFDNNVDAHEAYVGLSREVYGVDASVTYFWDLAGGAASENQGYTELALAKSLNVVGHDIDLSATVGYLIEEGEFSHATLKASYDLAIGSATLTPYVAYSFELDDLDQYRGTSEQNEFFAGAALSVKF